MREGKAVLVHSDGFIDNWPEVQWETMQVFLGTEMRPQWVLRMTVVNNRFITIPYFPRNMSLLDQDAQFYFDRFEYDDGKLETFHRGETMMYKYDLWFNLSRRPVVVSFDRFNWKKEGF